LIVDDEEFQRNLDSEYCKELDNPNMCNDASLTVFNPNCSCVHARNLDYRKSYQMVCTVAGPHGSFSHPIHMHGHSFWVLKIGLPPINSSTGFVDCFSEDIVCNRPPNIGRCDYVQGNFLDDYTCTSPGWATGRAFSHPGTEPGRIDPRTPRKDTIVVPAGGYAVIAMVADNPGVWFMHCHVENHAVEGMGVVLDEARHNQNQSPDEMRISGNFEPTIQEFYNWLDHDPDNLSNTTVPLTVTCGSAGYSTSAYEVYAYWLVHTLIHTFVLYLFGM